MFQYGEYSPKPAHSTSHCRQLMQATTTLSTGPAPMTGALRIRNLVRKHDLGFISWAVLRYFTQTWRNNLLSALSLTPMPRPRIMRQTDVQSAFIEYNMRVYDLFWSIKNVMSFFRVGLVLRRILSYSQSRLARR
jgi:hypothetical protein